MIPRVPYETGDLALKLPPFGVEEPRSLHKGFYGHKGRPGQVGGSAPREGMHRATSKDETRLREMKVPPAWTDVQIADDPKAKLQVVGKDAKGRTQYRYSAKHSEQAAAEKFSRVKEFGSVLPGIRERITEDMSSDNESTREAAAVAYLIDKTGFRIGSDRDTKADVKAFGATTLLGRHVNVSGSTSTFDFIGKKGVRIQKSVNDDTLADMIRDRKSGPNTPLFATSGASVRSYMDEVAPGFHPKDFRTYQGTAIALKEIKTRNTVAGSDKEFKRIQRDIAQVVATHLGNTPAISLKQYIDPSVWGRLRVKRG